MSDNLNARESKDSEPNLAIPNVDESPVEKGTDPLGDHRQIYQRKPQLILACLLGLLFAVLAVIDFSTGHIGRGLLAAVVALLNAYMAAQEQRKPKRPQSH